MMSVGRVWGASCLMLLSLGGAVAAQDGGDQLAMFEALPDGLYGRADEACSIDPDTVGDAWGRHFVALSGDVYAPGLEVDCDIWDVNADGDGIMVFLTCHAREAGEASSWPERWQVLGETSFRNYDTENGQVDYILCEASAPAGPVTPESQWTAAIVHNLDGGYDPCLLNGGDACFQSVGMSDETLRFIEARETEGGAGPVVPTGFQELGQVDIAYLGVFNAAGTEVPYFVNTSPQSISEAFFPERDLTSLARRGDPIAASLLRQYPDAYSWHAYVAGMRVLPNGNQRFAMVSLWTEFCRACPIIGFNVATVDYDPSGRFRAFETMGLFDNRAYRVMPSHTAEQLARDPALIQLALNTRGYQAGGMDGVLGPRSRAALAEFQRDLGINGGTGQVDAATLAALADRTTVFGAGPAPAADPETLSCDDPATALNRAEIRAFVENVSFGTREGAGRYVVRDYGPVDTASGQGRVTFTSDYGGSWESFEQTYTLRDGELCSQNLTGGAPYCERVRRCAMPGEAEEVRFLDDRNQTSVTIESIEANTPDDDGLPGRFQTPADSIHWLQVASRDNIAEARAVALEYEAAFPATRIFQAGNGWFAITVALLDDRFNSAGYVEQQKARGAVPNDALLTQGTTFVAEYPLRAGEAVRPEFWYARTARDTEVYGEIIVNDLVERRYDGEVIRQGTEVVVWIRYDGSCIITAHGNAAVDCADLSGLEPFPDAAETEVVADTGLVPLPLPDGVYAFDPAGCPDFDGTPRAERQSIAANLRVTLQDGQFTQGEDSCPIAGFSDGAEPPHLAMECDYGGTPGIYMFAMRPVSDTAFQRYDDTYALCTSAPAGSLVDDLRASEPYFYEALAEVIDDDALEQLLVALQIDLGADYNQVWSSPVYQRLMEGSVKIMLSPQVQRIMERVGFPDTGYIYALEWPSLAEAGDLGVDLVMDYVFDAAISVIELGLEEYEQPWDGGTFESFFDAAIPATLQEARFVLGALGDYRQGNYVDLAVSVFAESASIAADLYEAVEVFREVQSINEGTVEQAISGAVAALQIQEAMGLSGQRLPLLYSQDLSTIALPLMVDGPAWNVDTGRKLNIISELVLIRSLQMQGRNVSGYVETFNRLISEYEGTPISLWDVYANTVTLGLGGTDDYAGFSYEVATRIGLTVEAQ